MKTDMTIQGSSSKGDENIPRTSPLVKLMDASSLEMASVKVVGNPLYLTQNEDGGGMDTIHRPFYWEQKVFLPTKRNIIVLNSITGVLEYTLEAQLDTCSSSSSNTFVECACLVEEEHVVMASLSNATIVEWSINPEDLESIENRSVLPRRTFQLSVNKKILEDHQNTTAVCSHKQYRNDQRSRLIHVVSYPSHKKRTGGDKTYHYSNKFCLCAIIQPPLSSSTHGDSSNNKVKCCKLVEITIPSFEKIHNKKKNFTTIITTHRTIADTIPYCSAERSGNWNFPLSLHSFTCDTKTKSSQLHDEDSDTLVTMIAIVMKENILFYYDNMLNHVACDNRMSATERDQQQMKRECRSISYTPISGKFNAVKKGKKKKTEEEIVDTTKGNKHGSHISCVAFNTLHDGHDASVADMAIGYSNGHINIFYNFFATITHLFDTYMSSTFSDDHETRKEHKREKYRKLKHFNKGMALKLSTKDLLSSSTVIIKTLHWHVHPVLTMIFYSPTILMSAGEEAVVATWSLFAQKSDATMNKPTHTLPRVTKGDIILLLAATSASTYDTNGIVILGRENSVQFVSIPEYSSKWHLQGIACVSGEHRSNTCTVKAAGSGHATACSYDVVMKIDPRYAIPVCANLPGSPGFLQWYDLPNKIRSSHNVSLLVTVQMKLEVAAYNRVSRTDRSGPANLAANQVTHFAMSEDGTTLLTVDITLLQLTTLGRNVLLVDQNGKETAVSQVYTLKFWHRFTATHGSTTSATVGNETPPYELNALIMHPHGRCAAVTGLILSHNGNIGVTTSMEENCFRVWKRQASAIPYGTAADSSLSSGWKCVFHLQTPAGFQPPSGPMAFSPDDSLLAVANGNVVTLWDYEQSAFLRSIGCGHPESFTVKELYLDETARIIVTNTDSVKMECHSIFPQKEQSLSSSKIWEWSFNDNSCKEYDGVSRASITCYLPSLKKFAVAVATSYEISGKRLESCSTTKLFFVDALTGMQSDCNAVCTIIDGKVLSMCSNGDCILLWMDTNELIMVRYSHDLRWLPSSAKAGFHHIQQGARQANGKSAALNLLFVDEPEKDMNKKKMKRTLVSTTSDDTMLNKRQMIVEGFGIGQIQNSELPSLSSSFFRDFIGQRLPKFDLE